MDVPPPLSTNAVALVSLHDACFRYSATSPVLSQVNLTLRPGDRLLVLGTNGAGKSTLLAGLAGKTTLASGQRALGERWLQILHWEQSARDDIDPEDETAAQFVMRLCNGSADEASVLALLKGVGIDEFAARRDVGCLSSGERTLAALCGLCAAPKHLFILDEPTGFLGAAAVQTVAEALSPEKWPGTLVCTASSNRAFASSLQPNRVAVCAGGKVVLHDRPPCDADWAEVEATVSPYCTNVK